ncbi:helix-turn-helix transcriptional regulator [Fodinicola acaciae]|uniref:helix-turn-helix transcriptional regulator n=1 Tax=Fodinicola acaciae TaxID=2681555 RepID=UPI0013D3819A|nr:WYL domain-containing protein [Fodinicola acaciae]
MRASRLVQLLLLLQTRGQLTAPEIAAELEVSVRTVYRDLEALSAAGVPVYSEPGRNGGARLVDGYRTRLTGLTTEEADAVLLSGLPGPAADLGLGTVLAAAQLKMLAALPPELRGRARRVSERFHLDAPGWFRRPEETPALAVVADALWSDRSVEVSYQRSDRVVARTLDPLGLVLKAGTWYLVARSGDAVRSYRVGRIVAAELADPFERPENFDLAEFWAASSEEFARSMLRFRARCRIRASALRLLKLAIEPAAVEEALASAQPADAEGWIEMTIPSEAPYVLATAVLMLGEHAEVLDPPELRAEIAARTAAAAALYL